MSLELYRRPRLIVQRPDTSAHDAARAMESNHVGVVVVQQRGRIVGVVTDRDLALRVTGYGRDARTTMLRDVMTHDIVTLPITAEPEEALELMRSRCVRRIPLMDHGKLAGLVTVDDLLLEGFEGTPGEKTARTERLASVVRAQLAEPAPLKPRGATFPVEGGVSSAGRRGPSLSLRERLSHRHAARAEETYARMVHRVQMMTGLPSRELAKAAIEVVLTGIVRRITPTEAVNLVSQLPSVLHELLLDLPAGPDKYITRESIELDLSRRLDLSPDKSAQLLIDVGAALENAVSAGELEDVKGQLPKRMRAIFPAQNASP